LDIGRAIRSIKMLILFNSSAPQRFRYSRHFNHVREPIMADNSIMCDVAIVGSGFAGSLIANELSKKGIKVVVLEAGPDVQPNFNTYVKSFYEASAKVPESPYPPAVFGSDGKFKDPGTVAAGRPSSLTVGGSKKPGGTEPATWQDPKKAYLDQRESKRPFKSTYERLAGGTAHWMGLTPRLVPNDFRMRTAWFEDQRELANQLGFVDWPISYEQIRPFYQRAEKELGVSANVDDQRFPGIDNMFPDNYEYPMPRIPPSLFDQRVGQALAQLDGKETQFLGMNRPVTSLAVRSLPAARNSQPYLNRRACAGNTSCIPICPIQAKYDPTITLNEATNNGATLVHHAVAKEILLENDRVSGITFITYDREGGPATGSGVIKAAVYVIAANGIETPLLLLRSRNNERTPNGVANSSDMVGRNLMDHPQYLSWGLLPQPVFPYRGPLVTSAIGELCDGPFRTKRAAFRVSLGNEGWTSVVSGGARFGSDPNVTTLDFVNGTNFSSVNTKEFNGLGADKRALFGRDLTQTLGSLISRQFRIAFPIEQNPDANNRVTPSDAHDALGLPRPKINYDISDYTKQGFATAFHLKKLIFMKLGAIDRTSVHQDDPAAFNIDGIPETFTYGGAGHLMGTCRMGDDPKTSVVNDMQRSHDHLNLYLVGSGTFPTVGTANPTLTLCALALRTAENIVQRLPSLKA
jgi:glucose dehydrogenase